MKKIILILVVLFIPIVLILYNLKNSLRIKETFSIQIDGKITNIQKQNRGETRYYYNSDNFFIEADFNIVDKQICINDSVFKKANSKILRVYKKNVYSSYVFFK